MKDKDFVWLPYTQMKNNIPQLEVIKTDGSKIFLKDGRILIDGIASWWSVAHGYNNPYITKKIKEQLEVLPHVMLAGLSNETTYNLAKRLTQITNLDHVFFSDSGSTAIEVAMKICWQYFINTKKPIKNKFVSFKNSYHGDTSGAMSLADNSDSMHQKFSNILIKNFNLEMPQNNDDVNKFEEFIKLHHHEICGLFIEPIVQCAGGMKFNKPEILKNIYDICQKYEIIFVADECAVGFYRTGTRFACNHANITPDIMVLGKALTGGFMTLAATITNNKIFEAFLGDSLEQALMHGPTFMGNALSCAAASASLDLFEKNNYELQVANYEKYFHQNLKQFLEYKSVTAVREIGAIGVIQTNFNRDKIVNFRKKIIEYNVFLRPFSNIIYIMPSLTISFNELDIIINGIKKVLDEIDK